MRPAIEWLNEVGETVANSMFSGKKPPGCEVEALIQRIQDDAVGSVLRIRCIKHLAVPQQNTNEHSGGECGGCIAEERDRWPAYDGPKLSLRYTSPIAVLHHLPMSAGWSVRVIGDPDNGAYEWLIEKAGKVEHSDSGYGDSDIALRDGLIAMHGEKRGVS